ncbi:MAG: contractile injection system tape measure protein [Crocinitomicaceae bacterium]|nr:contractile injection system tape measure protein [Crocinitomicaceae bacterium]
MDVQASQVANPNVLLVEISAYLQEVVLPQLDLELDWDAKKLIQLEQVNIEFDSSNTSEWKEILGIQIAKKIQNQAKEIVENQSFHHKIDPDAENGNYQSMDEALLPALIDYLKTGNLQTSIFFDNLIDLQEKWLFSDRKVNLFSQLSVFLTKNEEIAGVFLKEIRQDFLKDLLEEHISVEMSSFIAEIQGFPLKYANNREKMLLLALKSTKNDVNSFERLAASLEMEKRASFYQFLTTLGKKPTKISEKNHKIAQKLMETLKPTPNNSLQHLVKVRTHELLTNFIHDLRQDYSLREVFDPMLMRFFQNSHKQHTIEDWFKEFSTAAISANELQSLLLELEDFQPLDPMFKRTAEFNLQLDKMVVHLETTLSEFELGIRTDHTSSISKDATILEPVPCSNAGMVLLHPFLPTLFGNLGLLDEANTWQSEEQQIWAIYVVHYLAHGNWSPEPEDLIIGKLLTGYSLDDEEITEQVFEQAKKMLLKKKQLIAQLDEVEIPGLLKALQENWRPMRNCTWDGLRNDFLNRTGEVIQEKNLQYVLTIESHALDVLIPTIKWGMAMIKYSWMEQVLNVEWGE